jgi:hypothetical protein
VPLVDHTSKTIIGLFTRALATANPHPAAADPTSRRVFVHQKTFVFWEILITAPAYLIGVPVVIRLIYQIVIRFGP